MKILVLNGSPRKGNTYAAVNAFAESAKEKNEVEVLDLYKYEISPCIACEACGHTKGCVAKDDTNFVIDKVLEADMIVFASPVYWWGVSAKMKAAIDKCYCRGNLLGGKKIGIIATGASDTDNEQYELIRRQFGCIAEYLGWEILFSKSFSASAKDELAKNADAINELKEEGAKL